MLLKENIREKKMTKIKCWDVFEDEFSDFVNDNIFPVGGELDYSRKYRINLKKFSKYVRYFLDE